MAPTLSQRRAAARRAAREIERTIDAAKAELAADRAAQWEAVKVAKLEERARAALITEDDLRAATHVRTACGWHRVVRVSPTSVTVATGYSWTDRYPRRDILEVARVEAAAAGDQP